jgi:hypothetical protein
MAAMANRFFLFCTAWKGKVAVDFVARRGVTIHWNGFSDLIWFWFLKREMAWVKTRFFLIWMDDARDCAS